MTRRTGTMAESGLLQSFMATKKRNGREKRFLPLPQPILRHSVIHLGAVKGGRLCVRKTKLGGKNPCGDHHEERKKGSWQWATKIKFRPVFNLGERYDQEGGRSPERRKVAAIKDGSERERMLAVSRPLKHFVEKR